MKITILVHNENLGWKQKQTLTYQIDVLCIILPPIYDYSCGSTIKLIAPEIITDKPLLFVSETFSSLCEHRANIKSNHPGHHRLTLLIAKLC